MPLHFTLLKILPTCTVCMCTLTKNAFKIFNRRKAATRFTKNGSINANGKQGETRLQDARDFDHQLAINNSEKWEMFTFKSLYSDFSLNAPVKKDLWRSEN